MCWQVSAILFEQNGRMSVVNDSGVVCFGEHDLFSVALIRRFKFVTYVNHVKIYQKFILMHLLEDVW